MKTVFQTNELAHVWAQQNQEQGRAGSFYFNGSVIYSYGSHFPIANIQGNNVLFTKRSYSNTTAKHIGKTRQAISHKNIIYCYDVPVNLRYATTEHSNNLNRWKKEIQALFSELGNTKIRNTQDRINGINRLISELQIYCKYFKLPVKDKELKKLIKVAASPEFINKAREAKEKENKARITKLHQAHKAYSKYLELWRNFNNEGIQELDSKTKDLCNFYQNNTNSFTHLRYNKQAKRVETSKGVQIPVEIAKKVFIQLNGCIEGVCKSLSIPVLNYTITETTKDNLIAGCHTIPKTDIKYISNLLNW